jgi:hypothetical protein
MFLRRPPTFFGSDDPLPMSQPKSNGGTMAAVLLGSLAAVGGALAIASASKTSNRPSFGRPRPLTKPRSGGCGCGR